MWTHFGITIGIVIVISGCAMVGKRPVEIEMPAADRHFIVENAGDGSHKQKPRPQSSAGAVAVEPSEVAERT